MSTSEDGGSNVKRIQQWLKGVEQEADSDSNRATEGKDVAPTCGVNVELCKLCVEGNESNPSKPMDKDSQWEHAETHASSLEQPVESVMKLCFPVNVGPEDMLEVGLEELMEKYKEVEELECSVCDCKVEVALDSLTKHVYGHWDVDRPLLRCGDCGLCDNDLTQHILLAHEGQQVSLTDYRNNDTNLQQQLAKLMWKCFSPKLMLPTRRKKELSPVEKLRASASKIASKTKKIVEKNMKKGEGDIRYEYFDPLVDGIGCDSVLGVGAKTSDELAEVVRILIQQIRTHFDNYLSHVSNAKCANCDFSPGSGDSWEKLFEHIWAHCDLPIYTCKHCDYKGMRIVEHTRVNHIDGPLSFNFHITDHRDQIMCLVDQCFSLPPPKPVGQLFTGRPQPSLWLKPVFTQLIEQTVKQRKPIKCCKCGYKPVGSKSKQHARCDRLESHVHYHMCSKPFECIICAWTGTTPVDHFTRRHPSAEPTYMDTRLAQKDHMIDLFSQCFLDNSAATGASKRAALDEGTSTWDNKRSKDEQRLNSVVVSEDDYDQLAHFIVETPPTLLPVIGKTEPVPEPVLSKIRAPIKVASTTRPAMYGTLTPASSLVKPGPCDFLQLLYDGTVNHLDNYAQCWKCNNCSSKLMFHQGGCKPSYAQIESHLLHHTRLPAFCCDVCKQYKGNDIVGHFRSQHAQKPLSYRDLRYDFMAELTASFYQCFAAYLDRR